MMTRKVTIGDLIAREGKWLGGVISQRDHYIYRLAKASKCARKNVGYPNLLVASSLNWNFIRQSEVVHPLRLKET